MTFELTPCLSRLLCTCLLVIGLAACAPAPRPAAYVVSGQAALSEERGAQCVHQHRPDRIRIPLMPPKDGWPGAPQAVVVMNVYQGEIEIRHDDRERCGTLQDARTLDTRFRAGMGTVLVPPRGDLRPIEVEFDPSPLPLWRPIVRLGEPAPVQRQDTFRFSLRVASVAVMLALVLSSLLTFLSTRERAFLSYAISAAMFALWIALLSGLWAYPRPWLPLDDQAALRLMVALPTALIGLTVRMLAFQSAPHGLAKRLRRFTTGLSLAFGVLALVVMVLPDAALRVVSVTDEVSFFGMCLLLAGLAGLTLWRGERGGVGTLTCVVPFLVMAVMEAVDPGLLALWKVEVLMLAGCWLGLTASMSLTLRLGSLRQQRDEMRLLAETDALTGLPNRRAALEQLARARTGAQRHGQPLAVCFMDIDHFKDINDRYGHDVGDRVLERFAATLRTVFRGQDYVARMGGEEFLVMLPGAEPEPALRRIESLRDQLDAIARDLALPDLKVTVSAGVTALLPHDQDTGGLLQRADAAMYAAKRAGRDRVELGLTPAA